MLRHRDLFQMTISHGLFILQRFQNFRLLLTILVVKFNLLSLVLLLLDTVLFGRCVVSLLFVLLGLSIFVQLSIIHTITMYSCTSIGPRLFGSAVQ